MLMKTKLLLKSLLLALGLSVLTLTGTWAVEPASVQRLIQTKECRSCELTKADLKKLDLQNSDLRMAVLSGANLAGADLSDVQGLTQEQLESAKTYKAAKLPDYLSR